ncbi:glutamic-type intramembrane protease PrsW [Salsuginibacillus kocurii]|uniref:glutamic-type intramembrane protease PrsW n=1 Tax=Salsuginibacillus kocurii TaxID=427078 RepID=UPI00036CADAF|nr:glutamic-type intramembrane protease PrsW [Salsuginibacillus kocurii]
MNVVALLTAGLAPGLALLTYFYLKNEYGTVIIRQVIQLFIIGALLVFPVMVLQFALTSEGAVTSPLAEAFISVAFLEELTQWFVLYVFAFRYGSLSSRYDAIVFGVSLSLGFASAENLLYLAAEGIDLAFGRALLPVSSHALFGVLMGYYLGRAAFTTNKNVYKWLAISFVVPFLLHGTYDSILMSNHEGLLAVLLPFMILLWSFALYYVKKANESTDKKE